MRISNTKKKKIIEQILAYLYNINPRPAFTAHIAREIARDEEFTKKILLDISKRGLVIKIDKNPKGEIYRRRLRWRLSDKTYKAYYNSQ